MIAALEAALHRLVPRGIASLALAVAIHGSASGASVSLTGAELVGHPLAAFPTTAPAVIGSSVRFAAGGADHAVLLRLSLPSANSSSIAFSVDLTRLGSGDWDPFVGVADGVRVLAGAVGDNVNGQGAANFSADQGTVAPLLQPGTVLFQNAGFPGEGQSVTARFLFSRLGDSTRMDFSFGAAAGTHAFPWALGSNIDLVLIRDNDEEEAYQLDSITLDAALVPEPGTWALVVLGLAVLCYAARGGAGTGERHR